jgi:hypothetical protein
LDRASRHQHRNVPGYWRLRQLRRRVGSPELFSPIAPKPLKARRYWATVLEIRRIEATLIEHGANVAAVLEARLERRRGC